MKNTLKYSCGCFYVKYKDLEENMDRSIPKFAFIASKKEFKKAVDRNYAKRIIKESVDPFLDEFPSKAYLFFIQKSVVEIDLKDLKKEVKRFVDSLSKK